MSSSQRFPQLNSIFDMEPQSSVQVCIRLQPPYSDHLRLINTHSLTCAGKTYAFDHVFCPQSTQQQIFNKLGMRVIANSKKGYNSCIFLYGQTGSGKTYTMTGSCEESGLLQKCVEKLWLILQDFDSFQLRMSYFQIYNQQVNDLMAKKKKQIKIKESINMGFYLENLEQIKVQTQEEILCNLDKGIKNRTTAQTKMNKQSSRSHSIFTLSLNTRQRRQGSQEQFCIKSCKIHFVDLAGSQKQKSTLAAGDRLRQASSINKSLTALSIVIEKLSNKSKHIPYRDSVLTKILRDSLGGNSKTILVATLSSKQSAISETISTLNFAAKAKKVKLAAKVNQEYEGCVSNMRKKILQLETEIKNLKQKQKLCDSCVSVKKDFQQLQKRYLQLQQQLITMKQTQINYTGNRSHPVQKNQSSQHNSQYIEYQLSTISQLQEKDSVISSKTKINEINIKYEQLKIELMAAQSGIAVRDSQIKRLTQQIQTIEKFENSKFKDLMQRFAQNLTKLRMNECQNDIAVAQHHKIKFLRNKLQNEQQSFYEQRLILQNDMMILKNKVNQLMRNTDQEFQNNIGDNRLTVEAQNRQKQAQLIKLKQLLVTQRKKYNQAKIQIDRLQIIFEQEYRKYQDLRAFYSQKTAQLQQNQQVINYWQQKCKRLQSQSHQLQYRMGNEVKTNQMYRRTNKQKQKYYSQIKQEYASKYNQMIDEINKKQLYIRQIQQKMNQYGQKYNQQKQKNKLYQLEIKQYSDKIQQQLITIQNCAENKHQLSVKIAQFQQIVTQNKQQYERLKQHLTLTTAQFNKILSIKQQEINALTQQASQYYLKCSQLTDNVKSITLSRQQLQAQYMCIQDKYKRAQKKYKDLRSFIKDEQTVSYQDLHKLQQQNSLLRDSLGRHHQRIQLMKQQYNHKNRQIEQLNQQLNKERDWVKNFTKFKKQMLTKKPYNWQQKQGNRRSEDFNDNRQKWQIGQTKIQLLNIIEKLQSLVGLPHQQKQSNHRDYLECDMLEKVTQIQNSIEQISAIAIENKKLKARNRYLSEKRNSDFIECLEKQK